MHALMQPQLVNFAATGVKATAMQAKSAPQPANAESFGTRFLAVLLACLSGMGT